MKYLIQYKEHRHLALDSVIEDVLLLEVPTGTLAASTGLGSFSTLLEKEAEGGYSWMQSAASPLDAT